MWLTSQNAHDRGLVHAEQQKVCSCTDLSLTEMAKPIKPETMPRGTHTPYLWMTSHPAIQKEKGLLGGHQCTGSPEGPGLKKSEGSAWDPRRSAHADDAGDGI